MAAIYFTYKAFSHSNIKESSKQPARKAEKKK
jgi:hypothetical protein